MRSTRIMVWALCLGTSLSVPIASSSVHLETRASDLAGGPQSRDATDWSVLDRMTPEQRRLFDRLSELASTGSPIPTLCWMEGTDLRVVEVFNAITLEGTTLPFVPANRWSSTATDGGGLGQGDPTNLTWSIVPDGTAIPLEGPSNLIAFLDAVVPGWLSILQTALDRWGQLSGINYIHEPNDDGVEMFTLSGSLGVRGDIRIGGTFIDGPNNALGYNDLPNDGDMVLDTAETGAFGNPSDNYLLLRNVVAHMAGHGLGLLHVESNTDDFLMEPFISIAFDGPQLDDMRGAHRHYGDPDEFPVENDDPQNATDLGAPGPEGVLSRTDLSIDDDGDVDVHSFDVTTERPTVSSITVLPTGRVYMQGQEGGNQSSYDSRRVLDLGLELLGTDGIEVLGSANSNGLGEAEVLEPGPLPEVPGTYYVRTTAGSGNSIQMYDLEMAFNILGMPMVIIDDTPGTATADGTVDDGEYVGFSAGINDGFEDVVGSGSQLHVDSDEDGVLNWGLVSGGGTLGDHAVVYIDTRPGGFGDTSNFTDIADPLRAAISATGFLKLDGRADIAFPNGFEADFAIGLESNFAGLWELENPASHTYIAGAPPTTTTTGHWEFAFTILDLGLVPGDSFDYIVTYGNAFDAQGFYRSDEFHGVATGTIPSGNIGVNPVVLAEGDFNTFHSYSSSSSVDKPSAQPSVQMLGADPNPLVARTTIAFELEQEMLVGLRVYDVAGRLVDVLLDDAIGVAGRNEVTWRGRHMDGRVATAGVYYLRLEAGNYADTKRMTLLK